MEHFPLFYRLEGKHVLIVGGGLVALRKTEALLRAKSKVVAVSPHFIPEFIELAKTQTLSLCRRAFSPDDLADKTLVIAATDDHALNHEIASLARKQNILVNAVDDAEASTFIFPALIERGPVTIAISTGGTSPVLARILRARIEAMLPFGLERLAYFAKRWRKLVQDRLGEKARYFWEDVLAGPVGRLVMQGEESQAEAGLKERLLSNSPTGEVYLIGAGPGNPELLTLRALWLLQRADVILYDRLVDPRILDLARRDAKTIYVGKAKDCHTLPQETINQLLVRHAKAGLKVARLKGGDPFIFGRGGEEIESLAKEGIPFEIVPGISAANGVAAYAGIPLTHRDLSHGVTFVSAHLRKDTEALPWPLLALPKHTLVVYMGLSQLEHVCTMLIEHGANPDRLAAVIESGTLTQQREVIASLRDLPPKAKEATLASPALLIVGDVIQLREKLAWFKTMANAENPFISSSDQPKDGFSSDN